MHPDLLLDVSTLPDPVARMKAIARWYVSGWHYKTVGVKKPFNPIVGETFACYWKHADGSRSQYFAEQVLHRPPISAIYFENRKHNMVASAHIWTKSQFSAPQTTKSILDGACKLVLTNLGEEYYITFPTYYAHNLLIGTLRMEVGDTAHIVCAKTGLRADIDFQQRGMWSAAGLNGVEGRIYKLAADGRSKGEELFTLRGHWDKQIFITPKGGKEELFLDVEHLAVSPKYVLPPSLQGPWESRRLWGPAAEELSKRPTVREMPSRHAASAASAGSCTHVLTVCLVPLLCIVCAGELGCSGQGEGPARGGAAPASLPRQARQCRVQGLGHQEVPPKVVSVTVTAVLLRVDARQWLRSACSSVACSSAAVLWILSLAPPRKCTFLIT